VTPTIVAFGAAIGAPAIDAGRHAVAVHGIAGVVRVDVKIAFDPDWLVRHDEAETVAMLHETACEEVGIATFASARFARGLAGQAGFAARRPPGRLSVARPVRWRCRSDGLRGASLRFRPAA